MNKSKEKLKNMLYCVNCDTKVYDPNHLMIHTYCGMPLERLCIVCCDKRASYHGMLCTNDIHSVCYITYRRMYIDYK